jgi:hypothetical protein
MERYGAKWFSVCRDNSCVGIAKFKALMKGDGLETSIGGNPEYIWETYDGKRDRHISQPWV